MDNSALGIRKIILDLYEQLKRVITYDRQRLGHKYPIWRIALKADVGLL
jgi:hypothetical protein